MFEQNHAWSEEDEMFVHGLIRGLAAKRDIHGHTTFSSDCIDITETINWLKSIKDRVGCEANCTTANEWSEEDEEILILIIARLHSHPSVEAEEYGKDYHWLKSLKDKVQPKQEWGEEDKQMIQDIINDIAIAQEQVCCKSRCEDEINWLKSLKDRYTWKPSDEQMNALDDVISSREIKYDILSKLWQDLNKLRDEESYESKRNA